MANKLNKEREWNYKKPKDISCPLMAHCVLNIEDISLPDCPYWVCDIPLSLAILGRYRMDQNTVTKRWILLFLRPFFCGFECTPDRLSEIGRGVICTPITPCIRVSGSIDNKKGGMWAVFISYRCFVCACCYEVKFDHNWIQMHACIFSSTVFWVWKMFGTNIKCIFGGDRRGRMLFTPPHALWVGGEGVAPCVFILDNHVVQPRWHALLNRLIFSYITAGG